MNLELNVGDMCDIHIYDGTLEIRKIYEEEKRESFNRVRKIQLENNVLEIEFLKPKSYRTIIHNVSYFIHFLNSKPIVSSIDEETLSKYFKSFDIEYTWGIPWLGIRRKPMLTCYSCFVYLEEYWDEVITYKSTNWLIKTKENKLS